MHSIRILLCRSQPGMGFEAIERLLQHEPSIHLAAIVDKPNLESALSKEAFDILIVQAGDYGDSEYRQYLRMRPDMAIVAIDLQGTETMLWVRDLSRSKLVKLIQKICEARQAPDSRERIHRVAVTDIAAGAERVGGTDAEPYASTTEHLAEVKAWLDLSLGHLLAVEGADETAAPIPGWTMNASQARRLLSAEVGSDPPDMLAATRDELERHIRARENASRAVCRPTRLIRVADAFSLDTTERRLLWHALAPEIDGRYARVHGVLNDDLTRRRPTLTRLAQLVDASFHAWSVRRRLCGNRPFALHRLVALGGQQETAAHPASEEGVHVAPEILAFLLDEGSDPAPGSSGLTLLAPTDGAAAATDADPASRALSEEVLWLGADERPIITLSDGAESEGWFVRGARNVGRRVLRLDLAEQEELSIPRLARLAETCGRVATLHGAILVVTGFERSSEAARPAAIRLLARQLPPRVPLLVLHGAVLEGVASQPWHRPLHALARPRPAIAERARTWRAVAAEAGLDVSEEQALQLASSSQLDRNQIAAALSIAAGRAEAQDGDHAEAILAAVRHMAATAAPPTVQTLEGCFEWGDIVLPDPVLAQLKSIPSHVRHAWTVFETWSYAKRMPYGQGVAALFSGVSGTGKTMAAQILARELGVILFRIDLSKVISKWLGETEKALSNIFDMAEKYGAVILIDEADAVFGKRTEIKDAHDRYANVEVAYLLQRIEAYTTGLAILTTNLRQNIDAALLRRLRFLVEFPAPGPEERLKIWQRAFPEAAPVAGDVDLRFLARRLNLTGGNIQQIAVRAAFAAAADGQAIGMRHVVQATREELLKLGMLNAERSLSQLPAAAPQPAEAATA